MGLLLLGASIVTIFLVLVGSEYLHYKKKLADEQLRKFVHVIVGIFVASWPWFMSFRTIQLVSIALLAVVLLDRKLKIFHALRSVKRKSYGDIAFAIGIGLAAAFAESGSMFAVAVLHMALADGLAAVIGKKFGKKWRYKVAGQEKTVIGTMAFWLISLMILGVGLLIGNASLEYATYVKALIIVPPVLAIIENIINHGFDNVAIPVSCVVLLAVL